MSSSGGTVGEEHKVHQPCVLRQLELIILYRGVVGGGDGEDEETKTSRRCCRARPSPA